MFILEYSIMHSVYETILGKRWWWWEQNWQVDTLLTKGCSPNPLMPSSVLNVASVKLIPSSVSKIFSWSMVCRCIWAGMCVCKCMHVLCVYMFVYMYHIRGMHCPAFIQFFVSTVWYQYQAVNCFHYLIYIDIYWKSSIHNVFSPIPLIRLLHLCHATG